MSNFGPSRVHPEHASLFVKGLAHKGSPPWREDDKDGHYMFALGENLTPRCNYTYSVEISILSTCAIYISVFWVFILYHPCPKSFVCSD